MNPALPVLLAILLSACASGSPVKGTDLVLYTKVNPSEAKVAAQEAKEFLKELGDYCRFLRETCSGSTTIRTAGDSGGT